MILPNRQEERFPNREIVVYEITQYYCPEDSCALEIRSGQKIEMVFDKGSPDDEEYQAFEQERSHNKPLYCPTHRLRLLPLLEKMAKA